MQTGTKDNECLSSPYARLGQMDRHFERSEDKTGVSRRDCPGGLLLRTAGASPAALCAVVCTVAWSAGVWGQRTPLTVKEGQEGTVLRTGMVFVAPADKHVLVRQTGTLRLSSGPKERHARTADPLFESVANVYKSREVAVVLTGLDWDARNGVKRIKENGGHVIAQTAETAKAPHVPTSTMMTGAVDAVLPLQEIAPALMKLVGGPPDEVA